jgi:hypothetical protein
MAKRAAPKKRPAASAKKLNASNRPSAAEVKAFVGKSWTQETSRPGGVPPTLPDWCSHFVDVFSPALARVCDKLGETCINVWSDHCGMTVEMFSLGDISRVLSEKLGSKITFKLHCACDNDSKAEKFTMMNHKPLHFSPDIFQRSFEEGWYYS